MEIVVCTAFYHSIRSHFSGVVFTFSVPLKLTGDRFLIEIDPLVFLYLHKLKRICVQSGIHCFNYKLTNWLTIILAPFKQTNTIVWFCFVKFFTY